MHIPGIHHVTAIAGSAAINVAFYRDALSLRLVKRTVNFDDPATYHLYYGDREGTPGSILTFFPFEGALPGRVGSGTTSETAYSIPRGDVDQWLSRFAELRGSERYPLFDFQAPEERMGEPVIRFTDPDGLPLSLVGRTQGFPHGTFDGVTLSLSKPDQTIRLLKEVFGYRETNSEGGRLRLTASDQGPAGRVDLLQSDQMPRRGAGTVHHVAFRARDQEEQLAWKSQVQDFGLHVTEVKDRQYFRSIYFREPGGVLFEIATDPPGFTVDESLDTLGSELKLPPWLESRREVIGQRLPDLGLDEEST